MVAITGDLKPRTGLNTTTGQRSAARTAGSISTRYEAAPFSVDAGYLSKELQKLAEENAERQYQRDSSIRAYGENYGSIGQSDMSPGAQQNRSDLVGYSQLMLQNNQAALGQSTSAANQAQKNSVANQVNLEVQRKNLNSPGNSTVSGAAFSGPFWQQMAIEDQAQADKLAAQRANNLAQGKTAADLAGQEKLAASQRYAAQQQADAQRFASMAGLIGSFANSGQYKYWN